MSINNLLININIKIRVQKYVRNFHYRDETHGRRKENGWMLRWLAHAAHADDEESTFWAGVDTGIDGQDWKEMEWKVWISGDTDWWRSDHGASEFEYSSWESCTYYLTDANEIGMLIGRNVGCQRKSWKFVHSLGGWRERSRLRAHPPQTRHPIQKLATQLRRPRRLTPFQEKDYQITKIRAPKSAEALSRSN